MTNKLSTQNLHSLLVSGLDGGTGRNLFYFKKDLKSNLYDGQWMNFDEVRYYYEPILNSFFFEPLLAKYPEMRTDVADFWENFQHEKYVESLLSQTFGDRIYLSDVAPLLFRDEIKHGNLTRRDLLVKLISNEPSVINQLQEDLLSDAVSTPLGLGALRNGDLLAYIDLLPKFHNEIKNREKIIECVNLIGGSNFTATNNSKAITTLIKIIPKNEDSIRFLEGVFSNYLNEQHNVRAKFQDFATRITGTVVDKKETIKSSEEFTTKISIPDHVLIDGYRISKNNTKYFFELICSITNKVMYDKFNNKCEFVARENYPRPATNVIIINSPDNETHKLVKELADKVLNHFDQIATQYKNIVGDIKFLTSDVNAQLINLKDTITAKISLEESLNKIDENKNENDSTSRRKMKI